MLHQGFPNALDGLQVFVLFACLDDNINCRITMQPMSYLRQPEGCHILIGEDEDLGGFRKHRSHAPLIPP